MSSLDVVPLISSNVVGRALDREAVLVDTGKAQVKVVNEVGAYIWSLVDGARSAREIAYQVSLEYEIDEDQAGKDTLEFIAELAQRGLVVVSQPKTTN